VFGTKRKFAWLRIAAICLVVITIGMVLGRVMDMTIFYKNCERSVSLIESLRPNRPEGVGAEGWNESINVTVTAFYNVCDYDPKNDTCKKMISEILLLKKSRPDDPLGKLCKIWKILYSKSDPKKKEYLDKMHGYLERASGLDCL
jgi:hypothetical protein